jgi:hypothetical protein
MVQIYPKCETLAQIRDDLDGDLDSVIATLLALRKKYEAAGYSKLRIDITPYDDYGSATVDVELIGVRPETEAEANEREARVRAQLDQQERMARQQYEVLKAKFG